MPNYCSNCGNPVKPGQNFCGKCGAKLNEISTEVEHESSIRGDAKPEQQGVSENVATNYYVICVVLVCIGIVLWFCTPLVAIIPGSPLKGAKLLNLAFDEYTSDILLESNMLWPALGVLAGMVFCMIALVSKAPGGTRFFSFAAGIVTPLFYLLLAVNLGDSDFLDYFVDASDMIGSGSWIITGIMLVVFILALKLRRNTDTSS